MRTGGFDDLDYERERDITWSELFYDLVVVVGVGRIGEVLREHLSPDALYAEKHAAFCDYLVIFVTIWRYWFSLQQYCTRYGADDLYNKLFVSCYMAGVVGMIVHVKVGPFTDPGSEDVPRFALSAAGSSVVPVIMYARIA
eukprot:COSAG05_NODE_10645_length_554_cov_0.731868_2_plen_141_part_00